MSRRRDLAKLSSENSSKALECEGCGRDIKKREPYYAAQYTLAESLDITLRIDYYHDYCLDPLAILIWLQDGEAVILSR